MTKDVDLLHVQSRGQSISLVQNLTQLPSSGLNAVLQQSVVVPPYSEMEVLCCTSHTASQKLWVIEGQRNCCAAMVARAVVKPVANSIPVHVLNPRDIEVLITNARTLSLKTFRVSHRAQLCPLSPSRVPGMSFLWNTKSALGIWSCKQSSHLRRSRNNSFMDYHMSTTHFLPQGSRM